MICIKPPRNTESNGSEDCKTRAPSNTAIGTKRAWATVCCTCDKLPFPNLFPAWTTQNTCIFIAHALNMGWVRGHMMTWFTSIMHPAVQTKRLEHPKKRKYKIYTWTIGLNYTILQDIHTSTIKRPNQTSSTLETLFVFSCHMFILKTSRWLTNIFVSHKPKLSAESHG